MNYLNTAAKLIDNAVDFVVSASEKSKLNKLELIRGSILDPLNHPSYTPEQIAATAAKRVAREKALERLEKKYA